MSDAIQKVQSLPTIGTLEFSADQRKMIRDSFLSGATEAEASVMLEVARLRRLNPLTGQIHFVKRWNNDRKAFVWSYQVAIDGFRAIAQRTGLYDGQDEPEFEYNEDGSIKLCRVRVFRRDWSRPSVGVAWFGEYAQRKKEGGLTSMWEQKPHIMAAKCAEALAFRKAFPEDMADLYAPEEMGEDDGPTLPPSKVVVQATKNEEVKSQLKEKLKPALPQATSIEMPVEPAKVQPIKAVQFGPSKGIAFSELTANELAEAVKFAATEIAKQPSAAWVPKLKANMEQIEAEMMERAKTSAPAEPTVEMIPSGPASDDVPF